MSETAAETAARYRNVAAGFTERVEAVPDTAWEHASPCDGWDARDVVRHVVGGHRRFFDMAGIDMPQWPDVDADPVGAWSAARDAMQAALDDPDVANREYESQVFGRSTLDRTVGGIGVSDVLVHTWDLARATGLDDHLDPEECVRVLANVRMLGDVVRSPQVFGPELGPGTDPDPQTALLAYTGREI
jgi:uncharacterized protein (TIGR03086 family)